MAIYSGSSRFGTGKQILKNAIHQKTMLRTMTKMRSSMKATMKMIWIEKEQTNANAPVGSEFSSGLSLRKDVSLPRTWPIFLRIASDIRKVTLGLNLRIPAMLTSVGSGMRIARAGASGSYTGARVNSIDAWLTTWT